MLRTVLLGWIERSRRSLSEDEMRQSAMIFAPHEDDETLGCGGTVARKIAAGAKVVVVFLTDGAAAGENPKFDISVEAIRAIRENEAKAACKLLGVIEEPIFLRYPDGRLKDYQAEAIDKVESLIHQYGPQQLYAPYGRDGHPDHVATTEIAKAAGRRVQRDLMMLEFPIWYRNRWPFIRRPLGSLQSLRARAVTLKQLAVEMTHAVDIRETKAVKRQATEQHRSQLTRILDTPDWPVLGVISGGDWLESFFRDRELFRKYTL